MRLYELRTAPTGPAGPGPIDRIVLVIAETEREATEAIRSALVLPEEPVLSAGTLALNDLGLHSGPEEPGSVFVNGYRIAC